MKNFWEIFSNNKQNNQEPLKNQEENTLIDYNSYLELAEKNIASNLYDNAIENCNKALELCTQEQEKYYTDGVTKENDQNYEDAIKDFDKANELKLKTADIYYKLSIAQYFAGQGKEAYNTYYKAYDINPEIRFYENDDKELISKITRSDRIKFVDYLDESYCINYYDEEDKIEECTKIIQNDPTNANAYWERAKARLKIEDAKNAIEDLKKARELDPENPYPYFELGHYFSDYKEALSNLDKAIELALKQLKTNTDKEKELKKLISKAYYTKSDLYEHFENAPTIGLDEINRGLEYDEMKFVGYYNRGSLKYKMGNLESAKKDFELVITRASKDDTHIHNSYHAYAKARLAEIENEQ